MEKDKKQLRQDKRLCLQVEEALSLWRSDLRAGLLAGRQGGDGVGLLGRADDEVS